MDRSERTELIARRLGAVAAVGTAVLLLPGVARSVRPGSAVIGHPERVFTPARLSAIGVGWFGAAAATWRPLPVRSGPIVRLLLAIGGLILVGTGLGLVAGARLALGASYRPSSTRGFTLAPTHRLVTSGPYGIVRHPMYVGLALAAVGALALYRTWATVLFIAQIPVLVIRARREEDLLAATYGEAWCRYTERVPSWLPRVGRARIVRDA